MKNTEEQVIELISSATKALKTEIALNSSIEDIEGWDSLSHLQIIGGIEKLINRRLTLDEMVISFVKDWVKLIENEEKDGKPGKHTASV